MAVDTAGNLFIADKGTAVIRKVDKIGNITTVAGNGSGGYNGDNGPAISTQLGVPYQIRFDAAGNLFIADQGFSVVRKINTSGIIITVAGNRSSGYAGDNGLATSAQLNSPEAVAFDTKGNIFIADYSNNAIRKINASGIITTVVGNGTHGYTGDGGPSTSALLYYPADVAFDIKGNIFIADLQNNVIRKIDQNGAITTVAGNGSGLSGDYGPPTSAVLDYPIGLAFDTVGNMFFTDQLYGSIWEIYH